CGWGDGTINIRECVAAGQIRENATASAICRDGVWKTNLRGWGCSTTADGDGKGQYYQLPVSQGFACDQGTCQLVGDKYFCRDCTVDPGVAPTCAAGETCPSGTVCNNKVCCPPGYCGWGDGVGFNRQCVNNGEYRENALNRAVCRSGTWKTTASGWGCSAGFSCDSGTCQNNYCAAAFPFSAPGEMLETASRCSGTCQSCSAQGKQCGIVADQCGGWLFCGACASGQVCNASGQCVASCTPNCSGKVCGSDACGGTCGACASGQTCNASGQCVASCVPATCSSLGKLCGVWNDNCGGTVNCGSCLADEFCNVSGQCVANDSDCTLKSSQKCDSGHLYWYDSCGNRGEMAQNCGANSATQNFRCAGNWVQQEVIVKDCASGACTESKTWNNTTDCEPLGKICVDGVCVASDIVPPVLFGLSPSGTVGSANVALIVSTNETSECRYGVKDATFGAMSLKFDTANQLNHSVPITLPSPGNYDYFVRCADVAGNATTVSAKISFVYADSGAPSAVPASTPPAVSSGSSSPIALSEPADKTPPSISDPLPSGEISGDETEISVVTDEKSLCRYDISDKEYGAMANEMESDSAGIFHKKKIPLATAGSHLYYVKCKDGAENISRQSAMIEFIAVKNKPGPIIFDISPSGTIYQKEIALEFSTNVLSVCRYSKENREFEEMAGVFSSVGGLDQLATVVLDDYGKYNYHIRCQDENGNALGSYALVSFEYKDPLAAENGQECSTIDTGAKDGACDNAADCVCDSDCPAEGEGADPDCANVAVQEKGGNPTVFLIAGLSALLLAVIVAIVIVARRKKKPALMSDADKLDLE
ncbi:MAG: hypothetical protein WC466_10665, partial [Candidatus Izemoplasmatales bacterium]